MPQIHQRRPLKGQIDSAHNLYRLLEGSAVIEAHRWCDKVQDAYSLRCAPAGTRRVARPPRLRRLHGLGRAECGDRQPARAGRGRAARLERQLPRPAGRVCARRAGDGRRRARAISERRTERLVNPNLSDGLPAFLTTDGGLNSGFMIPQYVAASLVSENKVLAHPASVDTIPTSAGQEDHVSMGNAVGSEGVDGARNVERTLAIELLAGAQGVEFLAPLQPGVGGRAARAFVRPALSAARGRPAALARHRARRGGDPRRVGPRGHRGRGGRAAMTRFERRRESRNRIKRSTDAHPPSRTTRIATARSSTECSPLSSSA